MDDRSQRAAEAILPAHLAGEAPARLCERLARTHYENFPVGSFLLPRRLRRHVFNVYAFCRFCDDLGDESGDPELSTRLLEWWREELRECYAGKPNHAIYRALHETITHFDLPIQPFDDLISAFLQDQQVVRYQTFDQILDYCSRSANPVGRLFLCLLGHRDPEMWELSDCTCTALQLANFWQDIPVDYAKGRVYIPQEDLERFGYSEDELRLGIVNAAFARLMRFEIGRTRELFVRGAALGKMISGVGAADVRMFSQCGMALLRSIERRGFNVFRRRITVPRHRKAALALRWAAYRLLQGTL